MSRNFIMAAVIGLAALIPMSASAGDTVRICTGTENGSYHVAGAMFASSAKRQKFQTEILTDTGGSKANIEMAFRDECDVFIAQPDTVANFIRAEPVAKKDLRILAKLHDEYHILLTAKGSRVNELSDLESLGSEASISVGDPYSSGAADSWMNLVANDDDYKGVNIAQDQDDTVLALQPLVDGDIDAIYLVTGMKANATLVATQQNHKGEIVISEMDDSDLAVAKDIKGKIMLESTGVPCNDLTDGLTGCFLGKTDTYKMQARLYVISSRYTKKELKLLIRAAGDAAKMIRNELNP